MYTTNCDTSRKMSTQRITSGSSAPLGSLHNKLVTTFKKVTKHAGIWSATSQLAQNISFSPYFINRSTADHNKHVVNGGFVCVCVCVCVCLVNSGGLQSTTPRCYLQTVNSSSPSTRRTHTIQCASFGKANHGKMIPINTRMSPCKVQIFIIF